MNDPAADAGALADRLLDGAAPAPGTGLRALAWALKERCYAAFMQDPPRAVRAAELLRSLAPGAAADERDEVEALAQWTAGIAALTRGGFGEAVQAFDAAHDGLQRAGRPDPAAQTRVPRIMALSLLGRHDEAVQCAESALRELRALGNSAAAARVSLNLGNLLFRRDRYVESMAHFRAAAVLFARAADHQHSVLADISLGDALTVLGQLDEARRTYERARLRAQRRALALPAALVDESLALLDLAAGRWRPGLAGMESARRRYAQMGLPQYLAIAEKQLGDAYLELRLAGEALALFEAAAAQFAALELPDEQAWALLQQARAQALLQRPEAADSFARAAALFEAQGNAVGAATLALAQGEWSLARGDPAAALRGAEAARTGFEAAQQAQGVLRSALLRAEALLALGEAAARPAFEAALAQAETRHDVVSQARCRAALARLALAGGDTAAARRLLDAAIAAVESVHATLPGDEFRQALRAEHLRPWEDRLRLALAGEPPEAVLQHLDRWRARALGDDGRDAGLVPDDEVRRLRQQLNWLYRRAQREGAGEGEPTGEILRAEADLAERLRRMRLLAAPGPADGAAPEALDVAALPGGAAVVAYGVLDGELFACVLRDARVQLVRRLAGAASLQEAVEAVRFQLATLASGAGAMQRHADMLVERALRRLEALHALVWQGLQAAVAGCGRVIVVPHGALAGVPFAALGPRGAPLGETLDLALAPSVHAALRALRQPRRPLHAVIALGESSRLPHAGAEAEAVCAAHPGARAWTGAEATLARLHAEAAAADLVHIACHAQFRADNPRFARLDLADAALTADEAEELPLRPGATVVLSACDTGRVDGAHGDEIVGLVRAFFVAGAARVLAAGWPVDDAVTRGFMSVFHAALAGGSSAAAALRSAQAATRALHPHPAHWAAFSLWGAW